MESLGDVFDCLKALNLILWIGSSAYILSLTNFCGEEEIFELLLLLIFLDHGLSFHERRSVFLEGFPTESGSSVWWARMITFNGFCKEVSLTRK